MDYQTPSTSADIPVGAILVIVVVYLALVIFLIAAQWKVNTKAGWPGWAAIVPFYNAYVVLKIAGKPGWWLILLFIPIVNVVIAILTYVALARSFGRSGGFAVGLIFLSFIFIPILGFGSSRYLGPGGMPYGGYGGYPPGGPGGPGGYGPGGYGPGGYDPGPQGGYPPPR